MNQIIKDSLNNSIDYDNYYRLMQKLVQDKYTTGDVVSDSHVNFTLLNEKRMSLIFGFFELMPIRIVLFSLNVSLEFLSVNKKATLRTRY